jgi:antitoxin component HigA of HigAB toxin-antitoxin module
LGSEINHSFNEPEVKQKKQFSLDISKLLERASMQQEQSQAAPMKKEIIRKFMKEKQRQMNDEAEKQKQQELKKTLKVHQNLVKLNNYCKKQLLNTTGRG